MLTKATISLLLLLIVVPQATAFSWNPLDYIFATDSEDLVLKPTKQGTEIALVIIQGAQIGVK
jgi:hypothetical protein